MVTMLGSVGVRRMHLSHCKDDYPALENEVFTPRFRILNQIHLIWIWIGNWFTQSTSGCGMN